MDEKSPLKWNNHVSSLLQMIQIKAPYTDASLACDGKVYRVHRVILSSCSEYFRDILKQTARETPFIILADIGSKNMEYLLHYMYKGEVNVSEYEIGPLLDAAEYLKIKGLTYAVRNKEHQIIEKSNSLYKSRISDQTFSPLRKRKKLCDNISLMANRKSGCDLGFKTAAVNNSNVISLEHNSEERTGLAVSNYSNQNSALQMRTEIELGDVTREMACESTNNNTSLGLMPSGCSFARDEHSGKENYQLYCEPSCSFQHEKEHHLNTGTKSQKFMQPDLVKEDALSALRSVFGENSEVKIEMKSDTNLVDESFQFDDDFSNEFPSTTKEWESIAKEFEEKWNFPNCLGAVDGKHVCIHARPGSGSFYWNYKNYNSVLLFAIANANYEFILCDIGTNGRVSDGGVIDNAKFGEYLTCGKLHIPPDRAPANSFNPLPCVFIGDDAFALRCDFLKHFAMKDLNYSRRVYKL